MSKNLYDEDSIQSLDPREFTRLRPQVYCGSTEYSTQLLLEILSNSIDEYKVGNGNKIYIKLDKDNVLVRDWGQGFIPMSFREDGKTVLEAAFSVLNTSGKFSEDGVYEGVSLGLYGIGAKLPIFLSKRSYVRTYRDGKFEEIQFKDGILEDRINGDSSSTESGTIVSWTPDPQFFEHTEINTSELKNYLSTIVCLCKGLTIELDDNGETSVYVAKNGLSDYLDKRIKDKEILNKRFEMNYSSGKNAIDLIMTYTMNYSSSIIAYVNTGLTESGPHITQIKSLITKTFNQFLREKKILKDKDENLTGDDLQEGLYLVFNITSTGVGYDAQVKTRVSKIDMKPFIGIIGEYLIGWCNQNEKDIKLIAEKALKARKAREAAKKAKEAIREMDKKKKEKVLKFDSKLADCYSKDRQKCEIYVTEGK